jgi:ribosomal-protein-alanine N-acetyltransferase
MSAPNASVRIESERLVLRIPTFDDREAVARYYERNHTRLAEWNPIPPAPADFDVYGAECIREAIEGAESGHEWSFFAFDREGVLVGHVTLERIERGPTELAWVGVGIDAMYEGKGLMKEAIGAAANFAFETLGLHRLQAGHVVGHERSARLLLACGFEVEGIQPRYLRVHGEWRDHVLYGLVANE